MSLYNALHGCNRNAAVALAMLNLRHKDTGRFRDAWIEKDGKHIVILTRNKNGDYQSVLDKLAGHPNYVRDWNDDFDSTYTYMRFTIPEKYLELAEQLKPFDDVPSLRERTEMLFKGIEESFTKEEEDIVQKIKNTIAEAMQKEKTEFQRKTR